MHNEDLLNESFKRIIQYLGGNEQEAVVMFKTPRELKKLIDFKIDNIGVSKKEFLELVDHYLDYSVRTGDKQFFNQLYAGFNFPAFLGEIFTVLSNTSMYTYEVAPVATMIENEIINLMLSYAGYNEGDGIFVSGGSNANLIAMLSARNKIISNCRFDGYSNSLKLVAFVNEHAHYSFETAANIIGIGSKNVIKIKSDENGQMLPDDLEAQLLASINRGEVPFFVGLTCATTLLGAYDPINKIVEITDAYKIWLHADGSFGGSLILSKRHRHLMSGIEKTDSFAWNPHKLMNIPLICSTILVKHKGDLQHNITDINADYIFHDIDGVEDLGKKSIQCGRRVDAVKLWFAWKFFGLDGYENRINNLISMAKYAEKVVNKHAQLELQAARQSFSVCFRYVTNLNIDLNDFNLRLRQSLRKKGLSIVNYGYIGTNLTIRLITADGELSKKDIDKFFNNLLSEAKEIEQEFVNNEVKTTFKTHV